MKWQNFNKYQTDLQQIDTVQTLMNPFKDNSLENSNKIFSEGLK